MARCLIRAGRLPADLEALAALYDASIRQLAAQDYTVEQVDAWASWPSDRTAFEAFLRPGVLLVAVAGDEIAGMGYLQPADHVSLLYTSPRFARQGIATRLYRALERVSREAGCRNLEVEASKLSRPLFEQEGFSLQAVEVVTHRGVAFSRYRMRKGLD